MARISTVLQKQSPIREFCEQTGVEIEGFSLNHVSCAHLGSVDDGSWVDDAGLYLCEGVTDPKSSVDEAFAVLAALQKKNPGVLFTPFRPDSLVDATGQWHHKPRYDAIKRGLQHESPETHHNVERMADQAALQVNFSGSEIEAFGDSGSFLMGLFNDLAPTIGAQTHKEINSGYGHQLLWYEGFGHKNRFPSYGLWFSGGEGLVDHYESTPRLIREVSKDTFIHNPPGEFQSIYEPLDLGVMWLFFRCKRGDWGEYAEMRIDSSMPLELAERYVQQRKEMVEIALDWFYGANRGDPVETRAAATPAYQALSSYFPDHIPNRPLTREEWERCIRL